MFTSVSSLFIVHSPEKAAVADFLRLGAEAEPRLQVGGRVKHSLVSADTVDRQIQKRQNDTNVEGNGRRRDASVQRALHTEESTRKGSNVTRTEEGVQQTG